MRPGSTIWLLAHEARLYWRGVGGKTKLWAGLFLGGLFVLLALLGLPLAGVLRETGGIEITHGLVLGVCTGLAFVFTFMLSHTLASAGEAFFARGDLDLLLSSPVPASRVLGARFLALAAATSAIWLFLVTPPTVVAAALGQPRLLGVPVMTAGLALLATAAGLWFAMTLFALIGPKRTRTTSQVLSSVLGALFFLVFQIRNFASDEARERLDARVAELARSGAFDPGGALAWPTRAFLGDAWPLALFVAFSAAAYLATVAVLGRRFADNAAAANGRDTGRARAAAGGVRTFSRGVVPATIKKELRLLARDPKLLSQVLLRLLYLLPLLALLWRAGEGGSRASLAGVAAGVTFLTGQLAGSLSWVTVSTEDAPDLLASSPARATVLRWAKLGAALIPVGMLLFLPVAGVIWMSPSAGLVTAAACIGAGMSSGLIRLWHGKPAKRADFNKRENAGGILINLADVLSGAAWGGAAYLGVMFGLWGLAPAAAGLALLAAMRRPVPEYAFS